MLDKLIAVAAVLLGLALAWTGNELMSTRAELRETQQTLNDARTRAEAQRMSAQALLDELTLQVQTANRLLAEALKNQEKTDEANKTVVAGLERRLADLGRLRDPHAGAGGCGPGGGGAAPGMPAPDQAGAADAAQTGGLLSEPLSRLLRELWEEADALNLAYASCRAQIVPAASTP